MQNGSLWPVPSDVLAMFSLASRSAWIRGATERLMATVPLATAPIAPPPPGWAATGSALTVARRAAKAIEGAMILDKQINDRSSSHRRASTACMDAHQLLGF
jgi:hypothetical protein